MRPIAPILAVLLALLATHALAKRSIAAVAMATFTIAAVPVSTVGIVAIALIPVSVITIALLAISEALVGAITLVLVALRAVVATMLGLIVMAWLRLVAADRAGVGHEAITVVVATLVARLERVHTARCGPWAHGWNLAALLDLLLTIGQDDAIVMLGMLQIILCKDMIARR